MDKREAGARNSHQYETSWKDQTTLGQTRSHDNNFSIAPRLPFDASWILGNNKEHMLDAFVYKTKLEFNEQNFKQSFILYQQKVDKFGYGAMAGNA